MRISPVRIAFLAGIFLAAASGSLGIAGPANAEEQWSYTCDDIEEPEQVGAIGSGHCEASNGAPSAGPIKQKFRLHKRGVAPKPGMIAVCEGAARDAYGEASLPAKVDGFGCYIFEN